MLARTSGCFETLPLNSCPTSTSALMYNQQCFTDQNMQIHFIVKRSTEELSVQVAIL